jgi:hypothetical protein
MDFEIQNEKHKFKQPDGIIERWTQQAREKLQNCPWHISIK